MPRKVIGLYNSNVWKEVKKKKQIKTSRIITDGIICKNQTEFERDKLLIQRAVDSSGDSVLITIDNDENEKISYMIPTAAMKMLLNSEPS